MQLVWLMRLVWFVQLVWLMWLVWLMRLVWRRCLVHVVFPPFKFINQLLMKVMAHTSENLAKAAADARRWEDYISLIINYLMVCPPSFLFLKVFL